MRGGRLNTAAKRAFTPQRMACLGRKLESFIYLARRAQFVLESVTDGDMFTYK